MTQAQAEHAADRAPDATGLAKSYRPQDEEPRIRERWLKSGCFAAQPGSSRSPYCIFIPPPNVTAALHLGHALNNSIQDALARHARMKGMDVLWMPGTDHAGIATQTVVEKRLALKGKRRTDFTREAFVAQVQAWKDEYEATILGQLQEMGASCDFGRTRFTMDPVCAAAVRAAFHRLFDEGLIERGRRLVNWDPATRTALADDEVEMKDVDGRMWYLRYPLEDGSGHVTVATTRPETMLGDTAVAVNPRDPLAASVRGKRVRLPIVGRVIPIVEDDYVVMPVSRGGDPSDAKAQVASGFLKVTPAHDPNDWEIGLRHGLPAVNVMGPDGSISDRHGWTDVSAEATGLVGLSREEARKAVVEWFRRNGLLEDEKPWKQTVGHSYRSGARIEPWLSEQWFVRVTDDRLRGAALRAMEPAQFEGRAPAGQAPGDGGLRFYPARYARTFQQWHENLRDWCISRQLWWGHRIPVWSREAVGEAASVGGSAPAGGAMVPVDSAWARRGASHRVRRRDDGSLEELLCLPVGDDSLVAEIESSGFVQDPDVLDTWFSSALWPLSTLGWPDPKVFGMQGLLERYNPSAVLSTAREIITLWVSRMTMFNRHFLGGRVPFRHVFIHPVIQDGFGQRMSKSLGNGLDPRDIIHSHGADALRYTLLDMTTDTQDLRVPVEMVDPHSGESFTPEFTRAPSGHQVASPVQRSPKDPARSMVSSYGAASGLATPSESQPLARNTSSRFDLGRNLATKLWNAARFVLANAPEPAAMVKRADLDRLDRWILSRVARAVRLADAALSEYRFSDYATACYDLLWRDFCDWYLEAAKPSARQDPRRQAVMLSVLDVATRLLHPAMPFVTEALWPALQARRAGGTVEGLMLAGSDVLATAAWPQCAGELQDAAAEADFQRLQALVNAIRNVRGERQVPPRRRVRLHASGGGRALVSGWNGLVEALAGLESVQEAKSPRGSGSAAFPYEGEECWIDGLVDQADAGVERARLEKVIADRRRAVQGYQGKLGNAGYVAKAPPTVVQETRAMLAAAEADLAAAERALAELAGA
jgi:valyl-tRNA synthetase